MSAGPVLVLLNCTASVVLHKTVLSAVKEGFIPGKTSIILLFCKVLKQPKLLVTVKLTDAFVAKL